GGRGGGGGGRGGGRGGRGGGRGGGGSGQSSKRKDEQQRLRREARQRRVEVARILYAKRERQQSWDAEAQARMKAALQRVLDQATE
ncbi:MAG: hypothetical protein ACYTGI_19075, partial [Planctomycetota bacterium]